MPDDAELLRQYAECGSNEAFAEFVRGRIDLVYSAAIRRTGGDIHFAKDVALRVFCAAASQAAAVARHPYPTAWLYEATRFTASSFMRAERRRKLREQIQSEEAQLTAESDPAWERLPALLDDAIDRLNEHDRTAVLLRFFDGLTFSEIARRLKLTDGGARLRVDRAVEKLRRVLARKGITSTTAMLAVALESQAIGAAPLGLASTLTANALGTVGAAITGIGGTSAFKSLLFMSTTKAIITGVAIVAIATSLYELSQKHRAETALAELTRERDSLVKRTEVEEAQNKQLQVRVAALSGRGSRTASITPKRPPSGQTLLRNPAYRKLQATTLRGQIDDRYAVLFKALGLNSDKLSQFKSLLVEKQMAATDAAEAARQLGVDPFTDVGGFTRAVFNAVGSVDDEIKATLGDGPYAQYQQYQQTLSEREAVNQLQQSLSYTQTPLSDDQANRVIEALAQTAPPNPNTVNGLTVVLMIDGFTNVIPPLYYFTDNAVQAAATVLLPDQVQALMQIQSQQQARRQISLMSGGNPPP